MTAQASLHVQEHVGCGGPAGITLDALHRMGAVMIWRRRKRKADSVSPGERPLTAGESAFLAKLESGAYDEEFDALTDALMDRNSELSRALAEQDEAERPIVEQFVEHALVNGIAPHDVFAFAHRNLVPQVGSRSSAIAMRVRGEVYEHWLRRADDGLFKQLSDEIEALPEGQLDRDDLLRLVDLEREQRGLAASG